MTTPLLHGVCAAMSSPFDDTGERLDDGRLRDHIESLIDAGVHGLVLCAGTGEFARWKNSQPQNKEIPLAEPISAAELKAAFDDSPPLEAAALAGVRARIREGVRLLESKDDAAFFKALVLPFKASAFRTDGDRAFLLARMREGAKHRWAAEADANVAVYYPRSSTVTLTPRPLELELVDGVWYLRRY